MSSFNLEPIGLEEFEGNLGDTAPENHSHKFFSRSELLVPLAPWANTNPNVPSIIRKAGDFCSLIAFVDSGAAIIDDFPDIFQLPEEYWPAYNNLYFTDYTIEVKPDGLVRYKPFSLLTLAPSGPVVIDRLIWRTV